jgi:hypothetical protein
MGIWNRIGAAYRWRRLLASCRLDPTALSQPVAPPGPADFIIAGCPRSGTSLTSAVLFSPPDVVTVMEPWDGLRLPPAELFRSLRDEIDSSNALTRGRLDIDDLELGQVTWQRDGEKTASLSLADEYQLGVKWPTFWQYLPLLPTTRFVVTLRHPAEVIQSFIGTEGRLTKGLDYDVAFNKQLNSDLKQATPDTALRRVLLYQEINSRILPYLKQENVFVVRYERWFSDYGGLLRDLASFLGVEAIHPRIKINPRRHREYPPQLLQLIGDHAPVARQLGYEV